MRDEHDPKAVRIHYSDGSVGFTSRFVMNRYIALYGEPTILRFEVVRD